MFHQKMQATDKGGLLTFFLVELGVILRQIPHKTKLP